ncbi:MAG: response regulator [Gemmatimonadetes bacterium]|nr:MAG: response regulator [Gemmatimonadota bacterium]
MASPEERAVSAREDAPAGGGVVLLVDDDPAVRDVARRVLEREGLVLHVAPSGAAALELDLKPRPDLCLLDVVMPGMDGYELCKRLRERPALSRVPVLFVTALGDEGDRRRAERAGAVGLLKKPFEPSELVETVLRHLPRGGGAGAAEPAPRSLRTTEALSEGLVALAAHDWTRPATFQLLKAFLRDQLVLSPAGEAALAEARPGTVYALSDILRLSERQLAQYIADFLRVPYLAGIDPDQVTDDVLPRPFCERHRVVPVRGPEGEGVVVADPFDWDVAETLLRIHGERVPPIAISEPETIRGYFAYGEGARSEGAAEAPTVTVDDVTEPALLDVEHSLDEAATDVMTLANELLRRAVSDRASDIHIEPKGERAVIRFRVDGDLEAVREVSADRSAKLIARFKALGHLDVAERRKPQDGAMEAAILGRRFKLRLATTSTPDGESLVIRLIEPLQKPLSLGELGMTEEQERTMLEFASRTHGLVLVVGPTGSGKSTTIFSLLSQIDGRRRSVITVEDPVEYRIPFANQQQVNEKAGVTFESLLKSAVRQDPDILLIGEIRDLFSAKAALEFASSGHLTLSSLHSSNATTAVFRLERLGIERGAMADATLGVVAQKLVKRLCERCRRIRPLHEEEAELLAPFCAELPREVAEPVGCPACRQTGYHGREGIYEILRFDRDITRLVREGAPIAEIRHFAQSRGDYLVSNHAIQKVVDHVISPRDAYEQVLIEEVRFGAVRPGEPSPAPQVSAAEGLPGTPPAGGDDEERAGPGPARPEVRAAIAALDTNAPAAGEGADGAGPEADEGNASVLVVDDDPTTRVYLEALLKSCGYEVASAEDGIEALMLLGRAEFDVVLSDVCMPNLDGLKLLEIMTQKGLDTPVIFLTADSDPTSEVRGLELGASDFLVKPVKKDILRVRLRRLLNARARGPLRRVSGG